MKIDKDFVAKAIVNVEGNVKLFSGEHACVQAFWRGYVAHMITTENPVPGLNAQTLMVLGIAMWAEMEPRWQQAFRSGVEQALHAALLQG